MPQEQGLHQVPHDYFRFTPYGLRTLLKESGFIVETFNPQLYGDFQANIRRIMWTLEYYIEEKKGKKNYV